MKFVVEFYSIDDVDEKCRLLFPVIIEGDSIDDAVKSVELNKFELIGGDRESKKVYKVPGLDHPLGLRIIVHLAEEIESHDDIRGSIWACTGIDSWL